MLIKTEQFRSILMHGHANMFVLPSQQYQTGVDARDLESARLIAVRPHQTAGRASSLDANAPIRLQ